MTSETRAARADRAKTTIVIADDHTVVRQGLRLLIDTGHVADWGGDPLELLAYADHVQLRQGRPGAAQLHIDDPAGIVDFSAVISRLRELDYRGRLSVEYFDLPELGWPLADPRAWASDLAAVVRTML